MIGKQIPSHGLKRGVLSKDGLKKASLDLLIFITQEAMIVFAAYSCDPGHI